MGNTHLTKLKILTFRRQHFPRQVKRKYMANASHSKTNYDAR